MSIALSILLLIHGLLHLIGFLKAFGMIEANQLTQSVPKPLGLLWLLAFVICICASGLLLLKSSNWFWFGFIAVFFSQILIIIFWQDAKFGSLANVIILLASILAYGSWSYYRLYKKDVELCLQQKEYFENNLLLETDMQHLPEAVKNYIRNAGCIGKPKVNHFKVLLEGKIRKNEQSEWMPFRSEQYNFMHSPSRLFFMKAEMKKLPVAGYHCYKNGIAFMDIRLFSMFKVQYQDGAEMNKAEMVTFFNDMCCMAPATLIDKRIVWQEMDTNKVKATFTNNGISINAELYFNEMGQLLNFKSNDRYNADAGKKLPWATPLTKYRNLNGYQLATHAETIYTYPDRDMCYGVFTIQSIEYNGQEFK